MVLPPGPAGEAITAAVDLGDARMVTNPDPTRGLSSSVKVGIEALPADADAALLVLGDQPTLSSETIRALLDAAHAPAAPPILVPAYAADAGRNPVQSGVRRSGCSTR